MVKKISIIILADFVLVFVFLFSFLFVRFSVAQSDDLIGPLPQATIIATSNIDTNKDAGFSYISLLMKQDSQKRTRAEKREMIDKISQVKINNITGNVIFDDINNPEYVIVFKVFDSNELLSLTALVEGLLRKEEELSTTAYEGYSIISVKDRHEGELMGYVASGNTLAVGSSLKALKSVIDAKKANIDSRLKSYGSEIDPAESWDIYAFIRNQDGRFTKLLNNLEKEIHLSLLFSSEEVESISIYFDIVDRDTIRGRIKFVSKNNEASFDPLQDDARFFSEIIKRICLSENVKLVSAVMPGAGFVSLDFNAQGLAPFWEKVILEKKEVKLLSPKILEKQSKNEQQDYGWPSAGVGNIASKVILLLALLMLIIIVVIKVYKPRT